MRLFLAISPPPEFVDQLRIFRDSFVRRSGGTLVKPKNYHLTLLFFGEVPESDLEKIKNSARRAARSARSFTLTLDRFGFLGTNLVSLFQRNRSLDRLAHRLRNEAVVARLSFDAKKFRPHLTLLRFQRSQKNPFPRPPAELKDLSFKVSFLHLMESRPTAKGSVYRQLDRFPLGPVLESLSKV